VDTIGSYEKLGRDEFDLSITERHLPDKLMSKFKKKVIILADWFDIFDLLRGLLIHCPDLISKGWQRNGIHNILRKLVHPDAVHALRIQGLHLLLVHTDIMKDMTSNRQSNAEEQVHLDILKHVIDFSPFCKGRYRDANLPSSAELSASDSGILPLSMRSTTLERTSEQVCDLLKIVLNYMIEIEPSAAQPRYFGSAIASRIDSDRRFLFWHGLLLRYFMPSLFPSPCHAAGRIKQEDTRGFNLPLGCPWELQKLLWAWFRQVRDLSDNQSKGFLATCWQDEFSSEVLLEIFRQRFEHFGQIEVLQDTMSMYKRWCEGRGVVSRMQTNIQHLRLTFVRHTRPLFEYACSATFATSTNAAVGLTDSAESPLQSPSDSLVLLEQATSLVKCVSLQGLDRDSWQALRQFLLALMELILSSSGSSSRASSAVVAPIIKPTMELVLMSWLNCTDFADKAIWRVLEEAKAGWLTHPMAETTSAVDKEESGGANSLGTMVISCWRQEVLQWTKILIELFGSFRGGSANISPLLQMRAAKPSVGAAGGTHGTRESEQEQNRGTIEATSMALLKWDRLLHALPPSTLLRLSPKLQRLVMLALLDVIKLWCAELGKPQQPTEASARAADPTTPMPLVHIAPRTLVAMFSPWLYSVATQQDPSFANPRAIALEALCRIFCVQTIGPEAASPSSMPNAASAAAGFVRPADSARRIGFRAADLSHFCRLCRSGFTSRQPAVVTSLLRHGQKLFCLQQMHGTSNDTGGGHGVNVLIPSFLTAASLVLDPQYNPTPPIGLQTLKATISTITSIFSLHNRYYPLQYLTATAEEEAIHQMFNGGAGAGAGAGCTSRSLQEALGSICMAQLALVTANHAMDMGMGQSQLNLHSAQGPVVRFAHEAVQSMCVWAVYVMLVDELACTCREGDSEEESVETKTHLVRQWITSLCHASSHPSDAVATAAITALANLAEFHAELFTCVEHERAKSTRSSKEGTNNSDSEVGQSLNFVVFINVATEAQRQVERASKLIAQKLPAGGTLGTGTAEGVRGPIELHRPHQEGTRPGTATIDTHYFGAQDEKKGQVNSGADAGASLYRTTMGSGPTRLNRSATAKGRHVGFSRQKANTHGGGDMQQPYTDKQGVDGSAATSAGGTEGVESRSRAEIPPVDLRSIIKRVGLLFDCLLMWVMADPSTILSTEGDQGDAEAAEDSAMQDGSTSPVGHSQDSNGGRCFFRALESALLSKIQGGRWVHQVSAQRAAEKRISSPLILDLVGLQMRAQMAQKNNQVQAGQASEGGGGGGQGGGQAGKGGSTNSESAEAGSVNDSYAEPLQSLEGIVSAAEDCLLHVLNNFYHFPLREGADVLSSTITEFSIEERAAERAQAHIARVAGMAGGSELVLPLEEAEQRRQRRRRVVRLVDSNSRLITIVDEACGMGGLDGEAAAHRDSSATHVAGSAGGGSPSGGGNSVENWWLEGGGAVSGGAGMMPGGSLAMGVQQQPSTIIVRDACGTFSWEVAAAEICDYRAAAAADNKYEKELGLKLAFELDEENEISEDDDGEATEDEDDEDDEDEAERGGDVLGRLLKAIPKLYADIAPGSSARHHDMTLLGGDFTTSLCEYHDDSSIVDGTDMVVTSHATMPCYCHDLTRLNPLSLGANGFDLYSSSSHKPSKGGVLTGTIKGSASKLSKLEVALHDPGVLASFKAFMEAEWAAESLDFWVEVESFKKLYQNMLEAEQADEAVGGEGGEEEGEEEGGGEEEVGGGADRKGSEASNDNTPPSELQEQIKTAAMSIYNVFIAKASSRTINLSSHQFAAVAAHVEEGRFPRTLFDQAQSEVVTVMRRDNFERYLKSTTNSKVQAPPCRLKLHDRLGEIEQRMWHQEASQVDVVVAGSSEVGTHKHGSMLDQGAKGDADQSNRSGTGRGVEGGIHAGRVEDREDGESEEEEEELVVDQYVSASDVPEMTVARQVSAGLGAALAGGDGSGGVVQAAIGGSGRLLCTHLAMLPPLELSRVRLLSSDSTKKASIERSLKHLDQSPSREALKIGVLYVGPGQTKEGQILQNSSTGSGRGANEHGGELHEEYEEFVDGLGWSVDLTKHRGFAGGLDKNSKSLAQGQYAVYHANSQREVVYHVASRMPTKVNDPQQINKKRHVGNDFVHIVWNENCGREYPPETIKSHFNDVQIVIHPLRCTHPGLYRIQICAKEDVPPFGPLLDGMVVSKALLPLLVRQTAVAANRCCRQKTAVYLPPYPTRRRLIDEIIRRYSAPCTDKEVLTRIFATAKAN
jgi:hypothetical protein